MTRLVTLGAALVAGVAAWCVYVTGWNHTTSEDG